MKAEQFRERVKEIDREHADKVAALDDWRRGLLADLASEFARSEDAPPPKAAKPAVVMPVAPEGESKVAPPQESPLSRLDGERHKLMRGGIDRRLEKITPALAEQKEFDVLWVKEHLEKTFPRFEFNRSTVYGGLERLAATGKIEIVSEGGRGEGNRRVYKVPAKEAPEEEGKSGPVSLLPTD
jgi:hypothetical protein